MSGIIIAGETIMDMTSDWPNSVIAAADIPARLERLPMTSYQRKLFAVIATAWLADQVDVALLAFLLGSLVVAFHLTPVQAGELAAMTFAGQLVGNIAAGTASDRFGRRAVFQVTMLLWGAASFAAAASWSISSLMVFRFLIGAGVGGEAPVAQAMVCEIVPAKVRGKYIAIMEGFWAVGYVFSGAISYFVLPLLGWRGVFVIVGLFSIVVLLARRTLPESPRWLADRGRHAEAEQTMEAMETEVTRRYGRALPPPTLLPVDTALHTNSGLATIFSRDYAVRTVMAGGLWFFSLIGFFGLSSWLAVLLHAHGFSIISSVGFLTIITLGGIPGFIAAAILLERAGRKPTTAGFLLLSAVSAYVYGHVETEMALLIAGLIMQFFMFGMWSCLYAYTPELYPTRARASGAGFASAVGRVGAILGPVIVPLVVAREGQGAAFALGAGSFAIAAALVLVLGVETRGRRLELVSG
jgi:putative MFS transporter